MIKKKLVATVGKYTDRNGQEKRRYVTIGHVHEGQYGDYVTLDPSVDLAGVYAQQVFGGIAKRKDDHTYDSRIMVSMYDPDESSQQGGQQITAQGLNDDIPF